MNERKWWFVALGATVVIFGGLYALWYYCIIFPEWDDAYAPIVAFPVAIWILIAVAKIRSWATARVQRMRAAGDARSTPQARLTWASAGARGLFQALFRKAWVFWVWLLGLTNYLIGVWFGGNLPSLNRVWILGIVLLWPILVRIGFLVSAKGWHRQRLNPIHWPLAILGFSWDAAGQRKWHPNAPYWIGVTGLAWMVFRDALITDALGFGWRSGTVAVAFVFWAATFFWKSGKGVLVKLPDGHVLHEELGRPHLFGFVSLLFKIGLLPAIPDDPKKQDRVREAIRWVFSFLRIFLAIGPILWAMLTFVLTRFWPALLSARNWWVVLLVLLTYWLFWALFGFRKIIYVSTKGPDGEAKNGVYQVYLPVLTLWGIAARSEQINRSGKTCSTVPAYGDDIVHVDPGMELAAMALERVKFWYVPIGGKFKWG